MNVQIVLVGSDNWLVSLRRCWRFLRVRQGRRRHNAAITIELFLKRAFWFAAIFGMVAYFGGAFALYLYRANMPHNKITYWDILQAPVNMSNITHKQGEMQLLQAKDDLENGKVLEAFFKYRAGIRRVPEDHQARMQLAQFFIASGMNVKATDLLAEGLDYGYPGKPYLRVIMLLTQHTQNNPALLKTIPKMLAFPEVQEDAETRVSLLQLLLRAQIVEQDYAGAIKTSEQLNDEALPKHYYDAILFCFLRMGAYDEANRYYQEELPEELHTDPQIILLHGYLLMSQGMDEEARTAFYSLFRDYPTAWRSHMDAIVLLQRNGETAAADSLLDLYLALHRRNGSALTGISAQFTDLPSSEHVRRIVGNIKTDAPELYGSIWFFYVQALVTEGQFEEAQRHLEILLPAAPKDPNAAATIKSYELILDAAMGRSAGEYTTLVKFLETNRLPIEMYWEAGEAMRKVGAYTTAELILNAGLDAFPFSRSLSSLRKVVLKDQQNSEFQSDLTVARVRDSGYSDESLRADPIEERVIGDAPIGNLQSPMESLVGDDKLKGLQLTNEDLNKSEGI